MRLPSPPTAYSPSDQAELRRQIQAADDQNLKEGVNLDLTRIQSISNGSVRARNLRGAVTFATAGTATVTFAVSEADASYYIVGSGDKNETFWITGKGTTGFTVNSSNAASVATYDWALIR